SSSSGFWGAVMAAKVTMGAATTRDGTSPYDTFPPSPASLQLREHLRDGGQRQDVSHDAGANRGAGHAEDHRGLLRLREHGAAGVDDGARAFDAVLAHPRQDDADASRAGGGGRALQQAIDARYVTVARRRRTDLQAHVAA